MQDFEMKKFIVKVIIGFILPAIVSMVIFEVLLRKIPTTYSYKKDRLTAMAADLQVLILGASHSEAGLDPRFFKAKAFNAAMSDQGLKYDYLILHQFMPQLKHLNYLIISVGYPTFYHTIECTRAFRIKYYELYWGIKNSYRNPTNHLAISDYTFSEMMGKTIKYYRDHIDDVHCNAVGVNDSYKIKDRSKNWYVAKPTLIWHEKEFSLQNYNTNYMWLRKIIQLCDSHQVKVVLVTFPAWKNYTDSLNAAQFDLAKNTCLILSSQHQNVKYYNFLNDKRFGEKDFFNVDHLTEIGAKKLTKILNDTLQFAPGCNHLTAIQ